VRERGALQELDYRAAFGHIAKWVTEIDDARRIPEIVSRAVHTATSGRPGPVMIALPEDMLVDRVACADARPVQAVQAHPGADQMARVRELLAGAERPLVVLGGSRWDAGAVARFAAWAQASDIPVTVSLRRQMLFPVSNPAFAGDLGFGPNPELVEQAKRADLVLLLGSRMSETPSQGYTLLDIPVPRQALIHAYPDAAEIGRVYTPTLGICATPAAFVEALGDAPLPASEARSAYARGLRAIYERWHSTEGVTTPGTLQMARVMDHLNQVLPRDAIVCNGAGNYATWVHRFYRFEGFGTQLAPTSGSMGYGVPAAVGAKRVFPERTVVAFAGDGCFLMNGQEFATAVQYGLPIVVIVVDNGMYGTIRMHQEREYPGRISATALRNPDFAAYAQAFGGHGERVERTEDFAPALARALASGLPSILHCVVDAEAISPAFTLSQVREAALAAGRGQG
jgi:acetolactate synthase-1/2/3 large subunit